MYYEHSGYPPNWNGPQHRQLYAVYSYDHDCFLYLHHDKSVALTVQTLLGSKLFTWVYELRMPEFAETTITNFNCTNWTLSIYGDRPSPLKYQTHYEHITMIDCTNVNILGEISGIDQRTLPDESEDLKKIKNWAWFIGWNVMKLNGFHSITDEILTRVMMAKNLHCTTDLLENDIFIETSKIYEILHSHDDIDLATQTITPLLTKIEQSTMINTFRFWHKDIKQWFPRHR
jgi:hypothetical protein